eukprot:NODE_8_length_66115_cov_0.981823.p2 type:complete len:1351 gc:universal NODE_8_length_66115_cov_0.981823:18809-22861(+)
MQSATIVQKLDYGYLVKIEDENELFLDSKQTYSLNASINVYKLGEKCVDHCVVEKQLCEGFVVAKNKKGCYVVDNKELIIVGPGDVEKYAGVMVSKFGDYFVGRLIVNKGKILSDTKSESVKMEIQSINLNSLELFEPQVDPKNAVIVEKYVNFCKEFSLSVLSSEKIQFFASKSIDRNIKCFSHNMKYGLLLDNTQFHKFNEVCRGIPCTFQVSEICFQKKKKAGHWCKIGEFKAFLPIHHSVDNIKIDDTYEGKIWDIQQDIIVVSLKNISSIKFSTLSDVKQYALSKDSIDVVVRAAETGRVQVDYFGIRSWIDGKHKLGNTISCVATGTLDNVHFRNIWSEVPVIPMTRGFQCEGRLFEDNVWTKDVIYKESRIGLYGPPLIVKPLIFEQRPLEIGYIFPFWIQKIDNNSLHLLSWHDSRLVKGIAFKRNISEYFISNLNMFKCGQTVLACIEELNEHGYVVSLKWHKIVESVGKLGFESKVVELINGIPDYVLSKLVMLPRNLVGTEVNCQLIKTVASGLHVQFMLEDSRKEGFIATSRIPTEGNFECVIINHDTPLFDLILKEEYSSKRKSSKHATVLSIKSDYAICIDEQGQIGYTPTRNFNYALQHGLSPGKVIQIESQIHSGVNIYKISIVNHKRAKADEFKLINPIDNITNLKANQLIKVKVTQVKQLQVHVKIADNLFGRILGNFAVSEPTLQLKNIYKKDDTILVKIITTRDNKSGRYLPLSHVNSFRGSMLECSIPGAPEFDFDSPQLEINRQYLVSVAEIMEDKFMVQIIPGKKALVYDIGYSGDINKLQIGQILQLTLSYMRNDKLYMSDVKNRAKIMADKTLEYQVLLSYGETGFLHKCHSHSLEIGSIVDVTSKTMHKSRLFINTKSEPIEVGLTCHGIVKNIQNNGVFVQICHDKVGRVKIKDLSDDYVKDWKSLVSLYQSVQVKVVKMEAENIDLSMKSSDIYNVNLDNYFDMINIEAIFKAKVLNITNNHIFYNIQLGQPKAVIIKAIGDKSDTLSKGDTCRVKVTKKSGVKIQVDLCTDLNIQETVEISESESEMEIDLPTLDQNVKVSKNLPELQHEFTSRPFVENPEFEKRLIENPNDSMIWLEYMAFVLKTSSMENARLLAKRALKSINFREESETYNIHVAILNMELEFGSKASFEEALKSSLLVNSHKLILLHCMSVCLKMQKYEFIENLISMILKEYKQSCKVWIKIIEYYFVVDLKRARLELQRSLKSLPKHKHIKIIQKFAQMEFQNGDPERARTILEGILNEYPKRLDLWSIYVDMEIKGKHYEQARQVFDKMLRIQFKPKQMKFIFSKNLKFEQDHGSKTSIAKVQQKAADYVKEVNMK